MGARGPYAAAANDRGEDGPGGLEDIAELAAREWGISADAFWDDRPNVDREQGLTVPRLQDLLEAHGRRRNRELREMAVLTAYALNKPEEIDRVLPPSTATRPAADDGNWWEQT